VKINQRSMITALVTTAFVLLPVSLAFALKIVSGTSWLSTIVIWPVVIVPWVAGVIFLMLGSRVAASRSSGPARVGNVEKELNLYTYAFGFLVLGEAILVGAMDWRVGVASLAVVGAWVVVWLPRQNRVIEMSSVIEVHCRPEVAFEFVSNPNNWPLYVPHLELVQPVDVPVHVGTVFRDRIRRDGSVPLEGEERVVILEAGKRFGTKVVQGGDTGISVFTPVAGGTKIQYTYRAVLSLPSALFGGGLSRPGLVKRMAATRAQTEERLRVLLEELSAGTV
jgi:hypothetical protein